MEAAVPRESQLQRAALIAQKGISGTACQKTSFILKK
jgi:hypothetical protein